MMRHCLRWSLLALTLLVTLNACDAFRQSPALPTAAPSLPTAAANATLLPGQEEIQRGDVLFEDGKYNEAIAEYSSALELSPDKAKAYNNRGLAYYRLGDLDRALVDYDKALALRPDYVNALTNRAFIFFDRGEYDVCIADASHALELQAENGSAHMIRGNAQLRNGDWRGALQDFIAAEQIRRAQSAQ